MDPLTIGTAVTGGLGVVKGLGSFFGARSQAKELRRQTRETVRRMQGENNATLGQARVAAGASSGVTYESTSLQDWLSAMDAEMTRQEQDTLRAGLRSARSMERAAWWNLAGDLGSTVMQAGAMNNWWRQKPGESGSGGGSGGGSSSGGLSLGGFASKLKIPGL